MNSAGWISHKGVSPSWKQKSNESHELRLLSKHYCALGYALDIGHFEFANALMDAGANPLNLRNAQLSLAVALYRSMGQSRRISEAGWDLSERMLRQGVNMPVMQGKGFAGFSVYGSADLHEEDIQKVERMREQFDLNAKTLKVSTKRSGPRL